MAKSSEPYLARLQQLQQNIAPKTAALISSPSDVTYFFSPIVVDQVDREALAVITTTSVILLHSPLLRITHLMGVSYLTSLAKAAWLDVATVLQQQAITTLLVNEQDVRIGELKRIKKLLQVRTEPMKQEHIWQQRMIKDKQERALIRRADGIATQAVAQLYCELKAGITEQVATRRLESIMFDLGADGAAFPTIVAFGPNTAVPHHIPTTMVLTPEVPILIDCGAQCAGYCSDMTRTFWFGDAPDPEFAKIDAIVHQAFDAAQAVLQQDKPTAHMVDAAARQAITQAGYGEQFIHTTGHGVGLSIHEPPALSNKNKQVLKSGMVITIEPGIYLEGKFGVRHEEMVIL